MKAHGGFQTLIGTVKGCEECFFAEYDLCAFQTLIGTVKGKLEPFDIVVSYEFQTLIGTVKGQSWASTASSQACFKPS